MEQQISLQGLAIGFIPVVFVLLLMWRSKQDSKKALLALGRMLLQLTLVGYLLVLVFKSPSILITLSLLTVMMAIASWLSLNTGNKVSWLYFKNAFIAMILGGLTMLALTLFGVLDIDPWYNPRYVLPLAGMILSNSMTGISLAVERYESEIKNNDFKTATDKAFKAAMIPVVNSLLAVGIVSLPGMMTGQILAGVEPYIAARYQIMVMSMLFSSTGISVFVFLYLLAKPSDTNKKG